MSMTKYNHKYDRVDGRFRDVKCMLENRVRNHVLCLRFHIFLLITLEKTWHTL